MEPQCPSDGNSLDQPITEARPKVISPLRSPSVSDSEDTYMSAPWKLVDENSLDQQILEVRPKVKSPLRYSSVSDSEDTYMSTPSWLQKKKQRVVLKLRFINSPPPVIFTNSRIKAKDGSPIMIELVNSATNTRVTFSSQLAEIVALESDITEESLTTHEFHRKIICSREGKRPLLVGDLIVTLKGGVGVISNVAFTNSSNQSRRRIRKFRLGAKVTDGGVVEAVSEAFFCMDHHRKAFRKHYSPYPDTDIWRLDKIAKNGITESHLRQSGIHTVKDLRRYLTINSNALPPFLLGKISEKRWNDIVSHSMHCVLDEKESYVYNSETLGASLLFNSVYEVMKVSFDDITYVNTTDLTSTQQEVLFMLKREAYENINSFVAADFVKFPPMCSPSLPKSPGTIVDERSDCNGELSDSIDVYASTDYDVVIIYKTGDICNDDFVSHLRAALCRKGIFVADDFEEVVAVPKCRVLIIFFTSTYVSSNLLNIFEYRETESPVVYPVFTTYCHLI